MDCQIAGAQWEQNKGFPECKPDQHPGGAPHPFTIDFAPLKPKIEAVKLSPFENMLEQTPVISPPFSPQKTGTSAQQTVMLPKWSPEAFGLGGAGNIFSFDPCAQNKSPEGKITYDGELSPFRRGVQQIVERVPVPVIPMALRGLWGSVFSRYGGAAFSRPVEARLRRGLRSRVELVVGRPVPPEDVTPELLMARVAALRVDEL